MTRGGVGCGLPPRGTPLTSVDVAPHLAEHAWPVDSGPQEFDGAVQSLVNHVVERCEDVRLQSTWKAELFRMGGGGGVVVRKWTRGLSVKPSNSAPWR